MAQFTSSFLVLQLKTLLKLQHLKGIHLLIMFTVAMSLYVFHAFPCIQILSQNI